MPTSPNPKGNAKYFPQKVGEEEYVSKLGKMTEMFPCIVIEFFQC